MSLSVRTDRPASVTASELTKAEAFDACQVLADVDRCLVRAGCGREASALAELFELIEDRLCDTAPRARDASVAARHAGESVDGNAVRPALPASRPGTYAFSDWSDSLVPESGSYSRESEFTQ